MSFLLTFYAAEYGKTYVGEIPVHVRRLSAGDLENARKEFIAESKVSKAVLINAVKIDD